MNLKCLELLELPFTGMFDNPLNLFVYRAPEVETIHYDTRSDVLSIGIIIYELLTGEPLFTTKKAKNLEGLHRLWKKTEAYGFNGRVLSIEALQFIQYCLQKDPNNRLEAEELYELDFIQNAYNDVPFRKTQEKHFELNLTKHLTIE